MGIFARFHRQKEVNGGGIRERLSIRPSTQRRLARGAACGVINGQLLYVGHVWYVKHPARPGLTDCRHLSLGEARESETVWTQRHAKCTYRPNSAVDFLITPLGCHLRTALCMAWLFYRLSLVFVAFLLPISAHFIWRIKIIIYEKNRQIITAKLQILQFRSKNFVPAENTPSFCEILCWVLCSIRRRGKSSVPGSLEVKLTKQAYKSRSKQYLKAARLSPGSAVSLHCRVWRG